MDKLKLSPNNNANFAKLLKVVAFSFGTLSCKAFTFKEDIKGAWSLWSPQNLPSVGDNLITARPGLP